MGLEVVIGQLEIDWDPAGNSGEVLAETTTTGPQALHAELDLAEVSDWVLSQQRGDVVGISYRGSGD
jgi:hypothetical protein